MSSRVRQAHEIGAPADTFLEGIRQVKPAPFEYHAPREPAEALAVLAEHGEDAKLLAGGQSLVPLLNFRLAHPAHLVDINGVGSLAYVRRRDGSLHVGAMTRQSVLEESPLAARHWPILVGALRWVAHPQIRNRGTVGGSIAHADPSAELPVASAALDARFHLRSRRGSRTVGWREFFITHLTTALEPDELLMEMEVSALPEGTGWSFVEFSRRHGDFALGGAAVLLTMDGDRCRQARIALMGAADKPLRAERAEQELAGNPVEESSAEDAAATAVNGIEPTGDMHGSSKYRRQLIEAMVRRAVLEAAGRAKG